jgi:hypothetical protein
VLRPVPQYTELYVFCVHIAGIMYQQISTCVDGVDIGTSLLCVDSKYI